MNRKKYYVSAVVPPLTALALSACSGHQAPVKKPRDQSAKKRFGESERGEAELGQDSEGEEAAEPDAFASQGH